MLRKNLCKVSPRPSESSLISLWSMSRTDDGASGLFNKLHSWEDVAVLLSQIGSLEHMGPSDYWDSFVC